MKWTYSIQNKLVASGALLLLCLLVLFSNYIDRNHTENVKSMIVTLYEDRLIAEEYILKMTTGLYQIKEVINSKDKDTSKVHSMNKLLTRIKEVNKVYLATKLTMVEKIKADELSAMLSGFSSTDEKNGTIILEQINKLLDILSQLSNIQLDESKQIMKYAESVYTSSKTSSEFVFALIIIILFVLQAIVFASKTLTVPGKTKSPHLN